MALIQDGLEPDVHARHHPAKHIAHYVNNGSAYDQAAIMIRYQVNISNGGVDLVAVTRPQSLSRRRSPIGRISLAKSTADAWRAKISVKWYSALVEVTKPLHRRQIMCRQVGET